MISRHATISPCGNYRYLLTRKWGAVGNRLVVIGLNPSTANEYEDDNTIRLLTRMAQRYGFCELRMLNLFAFRSTDPKNMKRAADPVGPKNEEHIDAEFDCLDVRDKVLLIWGAHGTFKTEGQRIMEKIRLRKDVFERTMTIGMTASGQPRHVLYTRGTVVMHPVGLYYTENQERLAHFSRGVGAMGSMNYFPGFRSLHQDYYWLYKSGKRNKNLKCHVSARIFDRLQGQQASGEDGNFIRVYPEAWLAVEDLGQAVLNRNRRNRGPQ